MKRYTLTVSFVTDDPETEKFLTAPDATERFGEEMFAGIARVVDTWARIDVEDVCLNIPDQSSPLEDYSSGLPPA